MQWDHVWMEKVREERLPRQGISSVFWELKQQRRRRLRKRHSKSELSRCLKLYRAYSISFNSCKYRRQFFRKLIPKSRKRKESRVLAFKSSTKRENRHFHMVVVQKCTKRRDARAKLLFCQSKPIAFLPGRFRWRRRSRCLSSLLCISGIPRIYRGV